MPEHEVRRVGLGKITGAFGVKGWVRIISWTEPPERIFEYRPWLLRVAGQWVEWVAEEHRRNGKNLVARLSEPMERERAAALAGTEIAVRREQLPATRAGEYYWSDLIGLEVRLVNGRRLGRVEDLMATGSNDVLVVRGERERLIPFIPEQVVKRVDLDAGLICVDWDPEF